MMCHHLPHTRKELEKVFGVFESTNHRGWKADEIEDLISLLWHTDDLILLDNWIVWSSVARQNFICLYQLLLQLDSALSCRYTWQITTKQDFYEVRLHRPIMFRTHRWCVCTVGEIGELSILNKKLKGTFTCQAGGKWISGPMFIPTFGILNIWQSLFEILWFNSEVFYLFKFKLTMRSVLLIFYGEIHLK